ncbi:hypothetical protein [Roseobacter fucihabitans]|uniref:hypothetical protein n=1 Tax=Roseobacter fucihabitans TaxID=1537242 RepID=UPI0021CC9452|nr:hypothetical protein [Roseobacter litoralis]
MRSKTLFGLAAVLVSLAGCASQIMQGYVGKSITEPMLDYGKPTGVFDLPDGTRAFQWNITESGVIPITNPTTSNIYGSGGWATVTSTSTSYQPYSQECVYTLVAKPGGEDWTVTGFRKPRLACE